MNLPTTRRTCLLLLGIVFLGLGLRLWGNIYGLPYAYAPDEEEKIKSASRLNQVHFQHKNSQPSFLYNSLFLTFRATKPLQPLFAKSDSLRKFCGPGSDFAYRIWMGRNLMAVLSSLTIVAVFFLARTIGDSGTGWAAAWLYAVAPLPVAATQYTKEDTPLALFTTLCILFCVRYAKRPRSRTLFLASLFSGASFAAKYPGALTVIIPFILWNRTWSTKQHDGLLPKERRAFEWTEGWIPLGFIAGSVLLSPNHLVNLLKLLTGVLFQAKYMLAGHHDGIRVGPLGEWFTFYLRKAILPGVTWPVALAVIPGALIGWRRNRSGVTLVAAWAVGYLLLAECMSAKPYPFYARYILPVIPMLCVLAAFAAARFLRHAGTESTRRVRLICAFAVLVVLASPACVSVAYKTSLSPDTRDLAAGWIDANIPANAIVYVTDYTPFFDKERVRVRKLEPGVLTARDATADSAVRFAVVSSFQWERFFEHPNDVPKQTELYRELFSNCPTLAVFEPRGPVFAYNNPTIRVHRLDTPPRKSGCSP